MRRVYAIESFSYSPSDHSTLECFSLQKMDIVGDLEKIEPKSFLRLVWQLTFQRLSLPFRIFYPDWIKVLENHGYISMGSWKTMT